MGVCTSTSTASKASKASTGIASEAIASTATSIVAGPRSSLCNWHPDAHGVEQGMEHPLEVLLEGEPFVQQGVRVHLVTHVHELDAIDGRVCKPQAPGASAFLGPPSRHHPIERLHGQRSRSLRLRSPDGCGWQEEITCFLQGHLEDGPLTDGRSEIDRVPVGHADLLGTPGARRSARLSLQGQVVHEGFPRRSMRSVCRP